MQSDYDGWLTTTSNISQGSAISLELGKPMATTEPIRTAEMRRQTATLQEVIDTRRAKAGTPGKVSKQIVDTIDAWIALVPVFQEEALKPDPRALLSRLDDFRKKTLDARDAIEAGL